MRVRGILVCPVSNNGREAGERWELSRDNCRLDFEQEYSFLLKSQISRRRGLQSGRNDS